MLTNGRVLVAGGYTTATSRTSTAELYDPVSKTWTPTGSMTIPRDDATATLLSNGKVLVAGGVDAGGDRISSAELYDPAAGTWTATGSMAAAHAYASAALLNNGKVLVAAGEAGPPNQDPGATAELYDPSSGTWTSTDSMATGREDAPAIVLGNGDVLVAGGGYDSFGDVTATSELYHPGSGTWTSTGDLTVGRDYATGTLLESGSVLMSGGSDDDYNSLASTEVYDPTTGAWTSAGDLGTARDGAASVLLPDGRVLISGGEFGDDSGNTVLSSAEVFDPVAKTWAASNDMTTGRLNHTLTRLQSGGILAAGGQAAPSSSFLSSAETFGDAPQLTDSHTTLAVEPGTATVGAPVTFTATVAGNNPTGTVTFLEGTNTLATVALSGGSASYTTSSLATGDHVVTASYTGDGSNNGSTTNSPVTVHIQLPTTTTTLTASPKPAAVGQSVVLTAAVSGAADPTGNITFKDGATTLGTATLKNGKATLTTTKLGQGEHSLSAVYGGNSTNAPSTGTFTEYIDKADVKVTLSATQAGTTSGVTVTYVLSVTNSGPTTAHNVKAGFLTPSGVTVTSTSPNSTGQVFTYNGTSYGKSWNMGDLAPGTTKITITATAKHNTKLIAAAAALSGNILTDPNLLNNFTANSLTTIK